jgi:hypothetical protein
LLTIRLIYLAIFLVLAAPVAAAPFSFSGYISLGDMQAFARKQAPLGSARDAVRQIFVSEGGAKRYAHPDQKGVEKYVYDVNLCRIYVWRWNLSANYNAAGKLTQLYVNGEPVHRRGDPLIDPMSRAKSGVKQAILKGTLPRPQASRGERSLAFLMLDLDTGSSSTSDEFITGAGPTRADPANLGMMHAYGNVEYWRSIFAKEGPKVIEYSGKCP